MSRTTYGGLGRCAIVRRVTSAPPDDPDHRLPCAQRSCDVVGVFLVDARGRVLLQERDEHAILEQRRLGHEHHERVEGPTLPGQAVEEQKS